MTEKFRYVRNVDSEGAEEKKITRLDTVCVGSFFPPSYKACARTAAEQSLGLGGNASREWT